MIFGHLLQVLLLSTFMLHTKFKNVTCVYYCCCKFRPYVATFSMHLLQVDFLPQIFMLPTCSQDVVNTRGFCCKSIEIIL
jgi:hypothetical protein